MSSDCTTGQYIEWCTDVPLPGQNRDSPVFLLDGNEYFFRLVFYNDAFYSVVQLYLKIKKRGSRFFKVALRDANFQVGFKNGESLTLGKGTIVVSHDHRLWETKAKILKSKRHPDYVVCGNCLKFLFFFEGVTEPLIKQNKEKEGKYIQTSSYLNAMETTESLSEDFSKLLDAGVNYDAEIKCGERAIKVHQIILSARSEVFKAMLESNMLEGQTGIVKIQDMDFNYLQDFIRYLYTGAIPELTFDKAKVFYETGDKYAVRSLMLRCSDYLQDNLAQENAFECFALADAHSDEKLKRRVKAFILEGKMYLQDELWLPFNEIFFEIALEVYRLSHERKISETEDQI